MDMLNIPLLPLPKDWEAPIERDDDWVASALALPSDLLVDERTGTVYGPSPIRNSYKALRIAKALEWLDKRSY